MNELFGFWWFKKMKDFYICLSVFSALSYMLEPTGAYPQPGFHLRENRTRRDISCNVDFEYPHGGICCRSCPAGKYVKSACTKAGEMGECEECHYGTYSEHANGLQQCLRCTQCHSDQEVVRPCSPTQNTACQCKAGLFCHPDQACEVCKKCSRCKSDEEVVRNCTATTNTECKTIETQTSSSSAAVVVWVVCILVVVGLLAVTGFLVYKYKCSTAGSQRNPPDGIKHVSRYADVGKGSSKSRPGLEDERKGLCNTPISSASNSQHSLTSLPYPAPVTTLLQASPAVSAWPNWRRHDSFPKLIPVNGEKSLRACFYHFEEVDVDYHKKFFRHLGFNDNVIKSKDSLQYEDKIHELLNIWVEREGRGASLNDLLKALLDLDQRRTAEEIKEKALSNNHYVCEC